MPVKTKGWHSWLVYMRFRNSYEAFFKFHLPLIFLFSLVLLLSLFLMAKLNYSFFAVLGIQLCLWLLCFLFLYAGFFRQRNKYLSCFGQNAYRLAAWRFLLPYGAFFLAALTWPLWAFRQKVQLNFPLFVPGIFFIVLGLLVIKKTLNALGIERLIYVYAYFPENKCLVKSGICAFLRHPAYSAWIYFNCGFFCLRGSFPLLISALLNLAALAFIAKKEESQITKDFPEDYLLYQKQVPAFFPRNPFSFLLFLLGLKK